jgi:hypothetical protein
MRTARSITSGENFGDFLILAPFSIERASSNSGAVQVNQRVVADLGRVGGNLNQLAHHLNQAALMGQVDVDASVVLAEIHELRDALEDALLGIKSASPSQAEGDASGEFHFDF